MTAQHLKSNRSPLPLPASVHPSEDALEEYAFDRLPPGPTAEIEEHLLVCEPCRVALGELDQFILTAKVAAAEYRERPDPRWLDLVRLGWVWKAATLTAAVGLVFLIPWHRPVSVPVATIELAALRGGATPLAQARAGSELDLKIDLTGLPLPASYRIEIVDAAGRPQWTGTATVRESTLVTRVTRHLASGVYWVRLFSESAELLREFGLKLG